MRKFVRTARAKDFSFTSYHSRDHKSGNTSNDPDDDANLGFVLLHTNWKSPVRKTQTIARAIAELTDALLYPEAEKQAKTRLS